ncbi:uncharacterized protein LOC105793456 [Gossypium raimondii]|uniref:uncharacterized protein LOC105793456 n=1 Tax=Gossypium raimondii TaxID=29730 RepID=UPI002279F5C6|nr:uncharacterized protein LOC105793456 [Gossypium raimondii]
MNTMMDQIALRRKRGRISRINIPSPQKHADPRRSGSGRFGSAPKRRRFAPGEPTPKRCRFANSIKAQKYYFFSFQQFCFKKGVKNFVFSLASLGIAQIPAWGSPSAVAGGGRGTQKSGFRTPISTLLKIYPFSPEKSEKEGFFVLPFSPIPTPKVVSGDGLSRPVLMKLGTVGGDGTRQTAEGWVRR